MTVTISMGWWLVPLLVNVICIVIGFMLRPDDLDDAALSSAILYVRLTSLAAVSGWAWALWAAWELLV